MAELGSTTAAMDNLRARGRPALRRFRVFVALVEEPRSRRATDAIGLALSVLAVCLLALVAVPQSRFEHALSDFIASLPPSLDGLWQLILEIFVVAAALVLLAAMIRRRLELLRDIGLALLVAFGVSLVVGQIVQGTWSPLWSSPPRESDTWVLAGVLVAPSAVLQTAGPHLRKSIRRVGRWLVPLAGFAAIALDAAPSATVAGLLVASIGADVVHLIFGSPQGRPSLADVSLALASLGVKADSLGVAERQPAGVFVVDAVGARGENLAVKIYGRDAYDTQLLVTAWRSVWYREAGSPVAYGRRQQVEREAFLTLLAAQEGVLAEPVVAAGVTADDDAILVLRRIGRPLSELPDPWPEGLVAKIWETVDSLHRAGISHGELDDKQLVIEGDRVGVTNFRGGDSGRDVEDIRTDEAQVLVTTALSVGPQVAVRSALDVLGSDGLAALLPFVQEPALTTRQRQRIRKAGLDLDDLRSQAAELSGIALPELRRMRRVTVGTLVQTGLLVLAFFALASEFAGLDVADLVDQLRSASWVLVFLGFVIGQLPRLSQAVSTLGAAPIPLPLGTVYALQLAQSYIGLAVPSSAGRVALNVRFFQRHGLSPGAALAIGAIDGFAGLVVQAALLIGLLLLTSVSLNLDLDDAEPGGLVQLVVVVLALSVVALIVLAIVPRWRRAILAWIGGAIRDAIDAVRGIRSPRRIGLLLGGSLGAEILFALSLGTMVAAFGYRVGFAELLLINMAVSLLSGLLPIPGGIGVVEGGLTLGLVAAGVPEETAFAAVMAYRLATFYLPPIWGFFALRWLERRGEI